MLGIQFFWGFPFFVFLVLDSGCLRGRGYSGTFSKEISNMKEMGLSLELESYIQNSIENAVGLPVSEKALQSKLFAMEESRRVLQGQIFALQDLVNDQNEKIERAKASHGSISLLCSFSSRSSSLLILFLHPCEFVYSTIYLSLLLILVFTISLPFELQRLSLCCV